MERTAAGETDILSAGPVAERDAAASFRCAATAAAAADRVRADGGRAAAAAAGFDDTRFRDDVAGGGDASVAGARGRVAGRCVAGGAAAEGEGAASGCGANGGGGHDGAGDGAFGEDSDSEGEEVSRFVGGGGVFGVEQLY